MQELLSDIRSREATYQAQGKTREAMRAHTAVSILGLLSTQRVLKELLDADADFAPAMQFATRKPLPRESPHAYRFRSGAPKGLKRVLGEITAGKLSGFTVDHNNTVYGSALDDIVDSAPYTVLRVPRTVAGQQQFARAPWGRRIEIMIVPGISEYTDQMRRQLKGVSDSSRKSRIYQNSTRLSGALARGDAIAWLPYDHQAPQETAAQISAIVRNEAEPDPLYRDLALDLAQTLKVA